MKRNRFSQKYEYPTVWGFEEEAKMFEYIWNSRPHVSFISGLPIVNPVAANFAHVLPKALNGYPDFRLNPENVVLITFQEHFLIDQGNQDQRDRYCQEVLSADFNALELLKTKLITQYQNR